MSFAGTSMRQAPALGPFVRSVARPPGFCPARAALLPNLESTDLELHQKVPDTVRRSLFRELKL
jgi:hypothetical protein